MHTTAIGASKRFDCTNSDCGYRYTEKGPDPCNITDLARIHQIMLGLLQQRKKGQPSCNTERMHPVDYPCDGWGTLDQIRVELGIALDGNWY